MRIVVLGAGILGVSTAWYLRQHGHEVTVVDRQPQAALETSHANGGQISVSFCEPWASREAPWKVLKWITRRDAPLLWRPQLDVHQWRWALSFLGQCHDAAFERNVRALVALGRYSQQTLDELVRRTGLRYDRLQRGILHFCATPRQLDDAGRAAELMRGLGLDRRVLNREQVLALEPALGHHGPHIAGGTYTASDESGDACQFTQQLAAHAAHQGVRFLYRHTAKALLTHGSSVRGVVLAPEAAAPAVHVVSNGEGQHAPAGASAARGALAPRRPAQDAGSLSLEADAVVVALGPYSAPFLRQQGLRLNIYPAKGYSATLPLRYPERASTISLMDEDRKLAITRLGDRLRVAGTAELGGYDLRLDTPIARARCQALLDRIEALFPGVADRSQARLWTGLRPSTPSNVPLIGAAPGWQGLWLNTGHGTLGWTHGAGSGRALAELMTGRDPSLDFPFLGASA